MYRRLLLLLAVALVAGPSRAWAAEALQSGAAEFVVAQIRFEGLARVSEGAALNSLPVNIGDRLTAARAREALRALFSSGFFRDVELRRDGNDLVIVVEENAHIATFKVEGNKEVKTEDLLKSLRGVGLATGRMLHRATLQEARDYLTEQYYARGRYTARIDASVTPGEANTVDVVLRIVEGKRARVRSINFVGNEAFADDQLRSQLKLRERGWLSWYRNDDLYARETLEGDFEALKSFYLDRGYAEFELRSTQVQISPERDAIFISAVLHEGRPYTFGDVRLQARGDVPIHGLDELLRARSGAVFSQKSIRESEEAIEAALAGAGFGFAEVTGVPEVQAEAGTVAVRFFMEPGKRVYARHVEFIGVKRTRDDVLRREMRQLEGALLSNQGIELSKLRLGRLPYIENVEIETERVSGSDDLADVRVTIKEGPSAQLGGGLGYSESQSLTLNLNYADSNAFGTGERVAIDLSGSGYGKVYGLSHTDPYTTVDGVSRTLSVSYAENRRLTPSFSQFTTKTSSLGAEFGWPLSEFQGLRFGLSLQSADLATVLGSSEQLRNWVRNNGDSYFRRAGSDTVLGTVANSAELSASWIFDSRNRSLFPTAGGRHQFSVTATLPGSELSFVTAAFMSEQYFRIPYVPVLKTIPLRVAGRAQWAAAIGDTTAVPPNRHMFVGGPDSVRGFREGSLGPRDSLGNAYGGDAGLYGSFEAILPMPAKFGKSARVSLFVDAGQAYFLGDTPFTDPIGRRKTYEFDFSEMRVSAGIGVQWLAPLGLFKFSFGVPLVYETAGRRRWGDELERFQFTVGSAF